MLLPLRLLTISVALAAAVACVVAVPATSASTRAADPEAQRWPGPTISYFDASKDPVAVARAVALWNQSGIGITFVPAPTAAGADLLVSDSTQVPNGCGTGAAQTGYRPGEQAFLRILHGTAADGQNCSVYGQTLVVAHELGHVLGLAHDDARCSVMNTTHINGAAPTRCFGPVTAANLLARAGSWRCRVLEPADVEAVVGLYGGTALPRPEPAWCDFVKRVGVPTPFAAKYLPRTHQVRLVIRRPAAVALPAFLRPGVAERLEVYRTRACLTRPPVPGSAVARASLVAKRPWKVRPGANDVVVDFSRSGGSWCWTAWANDGLARRGTDRAIARLAFPSA